jgi:type IV pilus assembly protein PilV
MKTHLPASPRHDQPQQAGFGLVEVMVALVVLAVGMLGIASLFVTTLRSSGSAISRMQAVSLAGDLADRIRANRFAGADYDIEVPAAKECLGITESCTKADMASNDLFLWQQQIDDLLPGDPQGEVVFTPATPDVPDQYTIEVRWKEPGSGDGEAGELSYMLTMQIDP